MKRLIITGVAALMVCSQLICGFKTAFAEEPVVELRKTLKKLRWVGGVHPFQLGFSPDRDFTTDEKLIAAKRVLEVADAVARAKLKSIIFNRGAIISPVRGQRELANPAYVYSVRPPDPYSKDPSDTYDELVVKEGITVEALRLVIGELPNPDERREKVKAGPFSLVAATVESEPIYVQEPDRPNLGPSEIGLVIDYGRPPNYQAISANGLTFKIWEKTGLRTNIQPTEAQVRKAQEFIKLNDSGFDRAFYDERGLRSVNLATTSSAALLDGQLFLSRDLAGKDMEVFLHGLDSPEERRAKVDRLRSLQRLVEQELPEATILDVKFNGTYEGILSALEQIQAILAEDDTLYDFLEDNNIYVVVIDGTQGARLDHESIKVYMRKSLNIPWYLANPQAIKAFVASQS